MSVAMLELMSDESGMDHMDTDVLDHEVVIKTTAPKAANAGHFGINPSYALSKDRGLAHRSTSREDAWLESSADGLLTLDAEKLLLSLPFDYVPSTTALIRPELINRLAFEWQRHCTIDCLIAMLDDLESVTYADLEEKSTTIRMELQILRAWLLSRTESVGLFMHQLPCF